MREFRIGDRVSFEHGKIVATGTIVGVLSHDGCNWPHPGGLVEWDGYPGRSIWFPFSILEPVEDANMREFKTGDKVRVNKNGPMLLRGLVGRIHHLMPNFEPAGYCVDFADGSDAMYALRLHELEPAEEPAMRDLPPEMDPRNQVPESTDNIGFWTDRVHYRLSACDEGSATCERCKHLVYGQSQVGPDQFFTDAIHPVYCEASLGHVSQFRASERTVWKGRGLGWLLTRLDGACNLYVRSKETSATAETPVIHPECAVTDLSSADMMNHPPHYARLKPEPIDVIEAWNLPMHLGNALKYIARWDAKGGIEDLKKCIWYLTRFIALQEKRNE